MSSSKTKKQSKTASSSLSNADQSASPRTSLPQSSSELELNEQDLLMLSWESRECKIWLSESSIVASFIAPGSLVSHPSSGIRSANNFPLSFISNECGGELEIGFANETTNVARDYFALATIFPSSKVVKNEVRLSSNLSHALGYPASGRFVFVYPIQDQLLLYLELILYKSGVKKKNIKKHLLEVSVGKTCKQAENSVMSSPRIPCQPKHVSNEHSQLNSPTCKGSTSISSDLSGPYVVVGHDQSNLGGLDKKYAILKDIIISLRNSMLASASSLSTSTRKTSLARLCAYDIGVNFFSINIPEIITQYDGKSERKITKIFYSTSKATPLVVFINELDATATARKHGGEKLSQRIVARLMVATNKLDSIEPTLRRPGRFDREIEIEDLSPLQRRNILNVPLSKKERSLSDMQVHHLAMVTHGFVDADLTALCNEATLVCLRRYLIILTRNLNFISLKIDPTLLRPGRFDRLLCMGPHVTNREEIFHIHLCKIPSSSDENIDGSEVTMEQLKIANMLIKNSVRFNFVMSC
ncbi:hypothetical protein K2173_020702 [Erythroxylum novogranatense]|uniref:ATPase AAA-type core domain-containing protein n=1 Tax=Erythroxylum novogranatense TaxID=1862640 RepID=A0AAV8TLP4_9ROSI|nr:hypothetical protein K2173_020702 [Erythroxylum novogranatense]